jgi:acetyl esterase/lipase
VTVQNSDVPKGAITITTRYINVKNRIVAIVGGSLGGNLSLMLASTNDRDHPYLKTIVAWSPTAMLKTSGLSDLVANNSWVGQLTETKWTKDEDQHPEKRQAYFQDLYFAPISNKSESRLGNLVRNRPLRSFFKGDRPSLPTNHGPERSPLWLCRFDRITLRRACACSGQANHFSRINLSTRA